MRKSSIWRYLQIYFNILKQETKIAHQCRPRRPSLPPPTSTCGPAYQPVAPPSSVAILGTTRPRTTLQVPTGPTCQLQSRLVCFNLTLIITCKSNIEKLCWTSSRLLPITGQSVFGTEPIAASNFTRYRRKLPASNLCASTWRWSSHARVTSRNSNLPASIQTCVLQPDVDHHMQE